MKWLWIAVFPVAVLALWPSNSVLADGKAEPVATARTFTVNIESSVKSDQNTESTENYTVTVYELPNKVKEGKKMVSEDRIVFVVEGDLDVGKNLPFGTMTRGDDYVGTDLEHPQGRLISRAFQPFFDSPIDPEHVKSFDKGEESRNIDSLALSKVPVTYRSKKGKDDKSPIRYAVKLMKSPFTARRGTMTTTLNTYERQFVLDPASLRILETKSVVDYERDFGGRIFEKKETITIKEESFRELKKSESQKVTRELKLLEPVAEAMLGGGVDYLRNNEKERNDLKKNVATYKKKHAEDGLLSGAFPGIESAFSLNLKRSGMSSNPEDIAKEMVKEPAPTFTLKDLEGNSVSLADFKGKAVVLNFWAVL